MNTTRKFFTAASSIGLAAALVLALTSVSDAAPGDASVTVVHGLFDFPAFDFCADGSVALAADVSYTGVVDTTLASGVHDFTLKDRNDVPCTGSVVATLAGVTVDPGSSISLVASKSGGSLGLVVFVNPTGPAAPGSGRLGVYHAAWGGDIGPLDTTVDGLEGVTGIAPATVKGQVLAASSYTVGIYPSGNADPHLLDLSDVSVEAGHLQQVFLIDGQRGVEAILHTIPLATEAPAATTTTTAAVTTTTGSSTTTTANRPTTSTTTTPAATAAPVAVSPTFTG